MPVREAHCAYCQKSFSFYHAPSTKPQRYCSVRCRGRALSQSRQGWKQPTHHLKPDMLGAGTPAATPAFSAPRGKR